MTSIGSSSSIRITGMATGMDTETMIKDMLAGEQKKIDRAKQKQQIVKWQQETYREVIKDVQSLQDKYFSVTSPNSIINSKAWNTLYIKSSNDDVVTATGSAGASGVDYKINVTKKATSTKFITKINKASLADSNGIIKRSTLLKDLGLNADTTFKIKFGENKDSFSEKITIRTTDTKKVDAQGKPVYKKDAFGEILYEKDDKGNYILDKDGKKKPIQEIEPADTIDTLIKKINDSTDGKVKASYSEMTGEFILENTKTGKNSILEIVDASENKSSALDFLIKDKDIVRGQNSVVEIKTKDSTDLKTLEGESNSFTIDGVTYNINGTGNANLTSKEDVQPVVDNMKNFIEDYNKLMDKTYTLITQKTNRDYPPLTEAQKKDMSKEEIERWEKKAKEGILRNDPEMSRFIDSMQRAIFGDNLKFLMDCGLTSHEDYNKKGQLSLNEDKFKRALENNGQKVYDVFAGSSNSVFEKMKNTMKSYVGTSSSIFAKKAGLEKTASTVKNFYSEQIKRQEDAIKLLQKKMDKKENQLYKQFSKLEASMNKLNSQMSYFMQM